MRSEPDTAQASRWSEVQAHVRGTYKLAEDKPDMFKLVFEYPNKRLQAVIVSRFEAMGREWCDFSSAVCRVDEMPMDVALRKNYSFAVGALCLDDDVYVVRYTVQLDTMDLQELEVPLHVVASTADELELEYGGGDRY